MTRITSFAFVLGLLVVSTAPISAEAGNPWGTRAANIHAAQYSQQLSWHGGYQYMNWGTPVALVVPPTANMQTNYSWGIPSSRMTPIHHQWRRPDPGPTSGASHLPRTPFQPNDTAQFGVYYVRGPWDYHARNPYHHQGHGGLCNGCGRKGCNGNCGLNGHGHGRHGNACGCNNGGACGCKTGNCGCNKCSNCQSGGCTSCNSTATPTEASGEQPSAPPEPNGV